MREYGFELRLCAHLETVVDGVVARQIGGGVHEGGRRVLDIVTVEPGTEFDQRTAITDRTIPSKAIHSEIGIEGTRSWQRAIEGSPATSHRVLEGATDIGFFERVHRDGRVAVRQTTRYPDWIGPITAIENKPTLSSPGELREQLRFDVAIGLVDRVILATASHVTGAHLNRIPEEVGVWRVDVSDEIPTIDPIREPVPLDPHTWGIELGDQEGLARRVRPVSPEEKRRARIRIAERVYGKGWRPAFPGCTKIASADASESNAIPFCTWKDRIVDPGGCGSDCPGYAAAEPPTPDRSTERDDRSAWVHDPDGVRRVQSGLEAFDESSK